MAKIWSKWRDLTGMICDKKVPTKMKLPVCKTVVRPTLLFGCDTVMHGQCQLKTKSVYMTTTDMRMVRWAMGVSLLEQRRNEEILKGARVEPTAMVMRSKRLE